MYPVIPAEKLPRVLFLLEALRNAPDIRVVRDGKVSFISLVRWIRRNNRDLYEKMLRVYGCDYDPCLARALSQTLYWLDTVISFDYIPEKSGDIYNAVRELGRQYPTTLLARRV